MTKEDKQHLFTFEEIFEQNKRRIHYHIHKMNIRDPHNDFFQEGAFALWNAFKSYQPDKGPMATYFNSMIRFRLIDKIRKETQIKNSEATFIEENKKQLDNGNYVRRTNHSYPIPNMTNEVIKDTDLWDKIKQHLTEKQWNWVYYYIIQDMSVKEIAQHLNTSNEAVKSWGKQVRNKFRDEKFQKKIQWDIDFD